MRMCLQATVRSGTLDVMSRVCERCLSSETDTTAANAFTVLNNASRMKQVRSYRFSYADCQCRYYVFVTRPYLPVIAARCLWCPSPFLSVDTVLCREFNL